MSTIAVNKPADKEKAAKDNLVQVHQNQQVRTRALEVVKSLFDQIRVIQQHRAVTNGALGGNSFFESKTRLLAKEINTRFNDLSEQLNTLKALYDSNRWDEISREWQTVHLQWRQDQVIENFELHSHLIRQLLEFTTHFGMTAESLIMKDRFQEGLSQYVLRGLPAFIETMGQMRALGTYAAVVGECSQACSMRLKFLLNQIQEQQINVRNQMQSLSPEAFNQTSSLIEVHLCDPKIVKLQNLIDKDVLNANRVELDPNEVFTRCTEIIDAHFNVMNEGLSLLRLSLDRRIQAWVHR